MSPAQAALYQGADREKVLIEGAKREGQFTLYTSHTWFRTFVKEFEKKYPFIKASEWRNDSKNLIRKVLEETKSGRVLVDVVETTADGMGILKREGLFQEYFSPEARFYPSELRMRGKTGFFYLPNRETYNSLGFNTKLIPSTTAPRTLKDLLDPKWKGKMAWRVGGGDSGAELFVTNLRLLWGDAKAEDYIKKLAKQDVVGYTSSARQLVNQVMAGEYAIALNIFLHHPLISAEKGAPVAPNPMEPIPALNGTVVLAKNAPNPHAAMLLIDFMLSKDGQQAFVAGDYFPANPAIEPPPELAGVVPSKIGMKQQFISPEKVNELNKKSEEWIKKYFR